MAVRSDGWGAGGGDGKGPCGHVPGYGGPGGPVDRGCHRNPKTTTDRIKSFRVVETLSGRTKGERSVLGSIPWRVSDKGPTTLVIPKVPDTEVIFVFSRRNR